MTTRREKIEAMLVESPGDVFLRYSLALELQKEGRFAESAAGLLELAQESPPYVPAYFMVGKLFASQGEIERARGALRDGIEAARSQGNSHAAGEMAEFLASLGSQGE